MLRPLGLAAVPRYDVLLITTRHDADELVETRVYDVADVLGRNRDANGKILDQPDFDSLINAITSTVRSSSWDGVGGPGSISSFESAGILAIVVSQTEEAQRELEALLSQVRSVAHANKAVRSEPVKPGAIDPLMHPATKNLAIRAALAKPLDVKYDKTPLRRVAADLQAKLGIPVQLDREALEGVEIATKVPITFASSHVSAKATIALMLRELGLMAIVRDDVLLLTTVEEAENVEETRVYNVSDLVRHPEGPELRYPDRYGHELRSPVSLEQRNRSRPDCAVDGIWRGYDYTPRNTRHSRRSRDAAFAVAGHPPCSERSERGTVAVVARARNAPI